jgi:16S rRNA (cytidine1402-2'-O)-methyltransferase
MLYITPTPIGNLEDITIRSLKTLTKAKIILCEDPRVTTKLLELLKIKNKPKLINLVNSGKFNYHKIKEALESIEPIGNLNSQNYFFESKISLDDDENVIALVSDAGMPGISDPGFEVIELAQELRIPYTVLPGPTSSINALVASNFCGKEFWFCGFLPIKKGRQTLLMRIKESQIPVVIFESSHRIEKLVEELWSNLEPGRKICITQELTKKYENIWVGDISNVKDYKLVAKGEFALVVGNI